MSFLKKYFIATGLIILILMLSACTTDSQQYQVNINTIKSTQSPQGSKYYLAPGVATMNPNNLEYQEYSHYLEVIFANAGFSIVENQKDADIIVFWMYGVGEPKEKVYSYATPVWGQTGVSSSTTSGNYNSYGNYGGSYSGTTTYTPSYGITGYTSNVGTLTTYERYLLIRAVDNHVKSRELWLATVVSEGSSNDLRQVFPVLALALEPYVGKDTGHQLSFYIDSDDDSLDELKNLAANPSGMSANTKSEIK